jgi:hypothetical protein
MKLVRVDEELLEQYRKDKPELEGLTYTGIVDFMLRKLVSMEDSV